MSRRVPNRFRRAFLLAVPLLLGLFLTVPSIGTAAEPFPGYPAAVREGARRVVELAQPGLEEALEPAVQSLRKAMFDHAVLSINAIPDRIFERARRDGWTDQAGRVLRPVVRVAPYSVPLWAWLIREDVATLRLDRLSKDLDGLRGALREYGPALIGCALGVLLFLCAAASWFVLWLSISLLLRAQPALTADLSRPVKRLPVPGLLAFVLFLACYLAPVVAGAGIGVAAVFWLMLSAGYLRRREQVAAVAAILLLGAVFISGGAVASVARITGETRGGGWLGEEGYFPREWPDATSSSGDFFARPRWREMVRFSRARAEMQSGNLAAAETMWTEWIRAAKDPADGYNNRGIVRVWLGKTDEALADFEAAAAGLEPHGSPAHWNAYQVYLQTFRLNEAARLQVAAWAALQSFEQFDFRPEEMTHGELIPSPLRVGNVWGDVLRPRAIWYRQAPDSSYFHFFFRPLGARWVPTFLVFGCLWIAVWKLFSGKVWMHGTCRACGTRTLIVGVAEATDICAPCRAQLGAGVRPGDERGQRMLNIALHRRYVRACSVLVPGAGVLWAGRELSSLIYGALLSLPLGVATVSFSAGRSAPSLISDMLWGVVAVALAAAALLWVVGAFWGWRSFDALQASCNIGARR